MNDSTFIITLVVLGLMLIVFLFPPGNKRRGNALLPTLLTSLGILGTFVGILYGLYHFDVTDLQSSIPKLLDGLKLAFGTSVVGLVVAIGLKYWAGRTARESTGATADTIANLLKEISETLTLQKAETKESLRAIETCLSGEGETTLVTQLQKLRANLADGFDRLIQYQEKTNAEARDLATQRHNEMLAEFRSFAETMAENNSKALIEALNEVIRDFNAKINEQFGENFKQLNEAVGKTLEWQQEYKSQMIQLIDRFNKSGESFDNIDKNLREIDSQIETVMELVDELDGIMQTAKVHLDALQKSVTAHANIAEKAENAFPIIEQNMKRITEDVSNVVKDVVASSKRSVETMQSSLDEQSAFLEQHIRQVADASNKIFEELGEKIQELIETNNNRIAGQFKQLHDGMEKELVTAIGSMGSHLASLSNRLVEDYGPLTEQMRKLIESASPDNGNFRRQ